MPVILLIEDDPDCARMVGKLLKPRGFSVVHTTQGLTGLQIARKCDLDLILVDINLPDLSGNVVILQLRGAVRCQNTPIIAFTAEASSKARRIAAALGCDGFLSKPIDPRAFPAQIDSFLTHSAFH